MNENTKILQSASRKADCNEEEDQSIFFKIVKEFDNMNLLRSSSKIFSYAIFKHQIDEDVDSSYLFNKRSALSLIRLEESAVDSYLGSWLGNFIRMHLTKISLGYVVCYSVVSVSVVVVGLYKGLKLYKALALVISVFKILLDLKKYVKESELKRKQQRLSKRSESKSKVGMEGDQPGIMTPEAELEYVLDKSLDTLEDVLSRLEILEYKIEQMGRYAVEDIE